MNERRMKYCRMDECAHWLLMELRPGRQKIHLIEQGDFISLGAGTLQTSNGRTEVPLPTKTERSSNDKATSFSFSLAWTLPAFLFLFYSPVAGPLPPHRFCGRDRVWMCHSSLPLGLVLLWFCCCSSRSLFLFLAAASLLWFYSTFLPCTCIFYA